MNSNWNYDIFDNVFAWCQKSNIGSTQGLNSGKYKLYIASAKEIKYYNDYMENGETLIFGTGGNPCIHYETGKFAYTNHCEAAKPKIDVCTKFYYYYFQKDKYHDLQSTFVGGGIKNSSKKRIGKLSVPVPTVDEQQRIVDKIEELFSRLDKGAEELNKIKDQLKIYRQAVLKEAFDGKNLSENYAICEISDIVEDIKIGPFGTMLHKEDYVSDGIPVVNPQHIKSFKIIHSNNITVTKEKADELSSYKLQKNDIIMGRRGEMGRVAPITDVEEGWICGTGSILFRLKQEYDAVFYSKLLASPNIVHYLEESATGTTMKNLNEKIVKHIPVPNITKKQQSKLMLEIDRNLSVCDKIEQTVNETLQKAESLRQSILKQAFEGKLV